MQVNAVVHCSYQPRTCWPNGNCFLSSPKSRTFEVWSMLHKWFQLMFVSLEMDVITTIETSRKLTTHTYISFPKDSYRSDSITPTFLRMYFMHHKLTHHLSMPIVLLFTCVSHLLCTWCGWELMFRV